MKGNYFIWPILALLLFQQCSTAQDRQTTVVFIRHAEKAETGDNLNCKGFNRSVVLPIVLHSKFGVPAAIYVPAMTSDESTKHCRMFQTISPFAIKYNLPVNSTFQENDIKGISKALLSERGTVFVVWEHKDIESILRQLGVSAPPDWPDDDFDSIWTVTITKKHAILTKDKEGLNPSNSCSF